jgi:hypothetical protein
MRLQLPNQLKTRDGSLTKDARLKNAFVTKRGENFEVNKRHGTDLFVALGESPGQGLFGYNGDVYAIANDKFWYDLDGTPTSISLTVTTADQPFDFTAGPV